MITGFVCFMAGCVVTVIVLAWVSANEEDAP